MPNDVNSTNPPTVPPKSNVALLGCLGAFVVAIIALAISSGTDESRDATTSRATSDNFSRVRIGMSISQVEALLGKGELKSRIVSPGGGTEEMYTWRKHGGGAFGVALIDDRVVIAQEAIDD